MKKRALIIILMGFIMSGFTYLQSSNSVDKISKGDQILIANYAKISGLKERLVTIKRLSDIKRIDNKEYASKLDNINQQLKMIIYDSKMVYENTINQTGKKYPGKINIIKWLRLYEFKQNYKNINSLYAQILAFHKSKNPSKKLEDSLINRLIKHFKNTKETRQIHLVYNDEKEKSNALSTNKKDITEIKIAEDIKKVQPEKKIKKPKYRSLAMLREKERKNNDSNIIYKKTIDKELLKNTKTLLEIQNSKGTFDYIGIKNNADTNASGDVYGKDYISLRVKDALKGDMFRLDSKVKNTNQIQEVSFGKVNYTYSPKINKYTRKIGDDFEMACDNIVFQMIKSERKKDKFYPDAIGFGNAIAFCAGKTVKGVWLKESPKKSLKFYNTEGDEISLLPGRTVVVVIPEEETVSYHYY